MTRIKNSFAEYIPHRFSPGTWRKPGSPAPVPRNAASNPISKSSPNIRALPMIASVSILTPRLSTYLTSSFTMSLGILNSGIPYMRTPPGACKASKIVTSWPSLASSAAAVNPAGPDPITATFFAVGSVTSGLPTLFVLSQSAANLSSAPIFMGTPLTPKTHFSIHWISWGQTLPQMAGRLFFSLIFLIASPVLPSFMNSMKAGMSMFTGQPSTHLGTLHWRHRSASTRACSSL